MKVGWRVSAGRLAHETGGAPNWTMPCRTDESPDPAGRWEKPEAE